MLGLVTKVVLCCCVFGIKGQSLYDDIIAKAAEIRANGGPPPYGQPIQKAAGPGPVSGQQKLPIVGSRIPFTLTSMNNDNLVGLVGHQSGLTGIDGKTGHMGSFIGAAAYKPIGGYSAGVTSGGTVTSTNYDNLVGHQSGLTDIYGNNGHMGSFIGAAAAKTIGGYSAGVTSDGPAPRYPFTSYNASPLVERGPFSSLFGRRLNSQRYPALAYYPAGAFAGGSDDVDEQDDDYMQLGPGQRGVVSSRRLFYDNQSSSELND